MVFVNLKTSPSFILFQSSEKTKKRGNSMQLNKSNDLSLTSKKFTPRRNYFRFITRKQVTTTMPGPR